MKMHDKASEFTVQNEFIMTPRPRKYFAVITLPSGAQVELPRQETPESALNRAKDHGYSEDQITIKMETPIPGQSETVPTKTLRERFEDWAKTKWSTKYVERITTHPNEEPFYRVDEIQLAWEAFQEGAKAVS